MSEVTHAALSEVASLNPREKLELPANEEVSFVPMSAVCADTGTIANEESREFQEVSKGFTPFLDSDVLVAKITPCFQNGKIAYANITRNFGFGSTEFHVVRPNPEVLDSRYAYHFLRQPVIRVAGERRMTGSAGQRRVPKQFLAKLKVPILPLDEQKRIAEVLDRAEALRARRRAALALLDELTQSTFLDMFGDPVTNPEGWPIRPIAELAENKDSMRVPIKQSDRDERSGKYPYYGSVGIIDDIDDFIYEGPHLLISEDGKHLETRNRPIACLADGQFWVNNHAHVLAANGNAELVFLAFNLEMRPLHQFVTGIDQFKLNRKSMDKIPVAVPPIELQQEFAKRINAIERQKMRLNAHLTELGSLFACLQSRAFKGELFPTTDTEKPSVNHLIATNRELKCPNKL